MNNRLFLFYMKLKGVFYKQEIMIYSAKTYSNFISRLFIKYSMVKELSYEKKLY